MRRRKWPTGILLMASILVLVVLSGCNKVQGKQASDGASPSSKVVTVPDASLFSVDKPEQFPLAAAAARLTNSELVVTGSVMPDIARNVPVVSLASGRVVSIHARLGDAVRKGQVLLTVHSDDVSGGFQSYRHAVADESLARAQLERAKDLYDHGAIALNDLQVAENAERKAIVDVETTAEHLRLLGNDPDQPAKMVDIVAPASGVITDQQVTTGSAVQAFNTPSPFTISDLSHVWIVCDVYENELANVKIGDAAEITLNAFPGRTFNGTVSNIGVILDPSIRTAKVRIEVQNPGPMRLGMFARATFRGKSSVTHTIVPASAILHMHDRDFVFVPTADKQFRRVEVVSGGLLRDNLSLQEIKSGLDPGQQVVSNALVLDHVLTQ